MKKKVELVCTDFKVWDLMDAFQTALKPFGLILTDSPAFRSSNRFPAPVFYISNYKLSAKELKALDKEAGFTLSGGEE